MVYSIMDGLETRPPQGRGIVGQTTDDGLTRPTPIIRTRTEHVRVVRGQTTPLCHASIASVVFVCALFALFCSRCHVAATPHSINNNSKQQATTNDLSFVIAEGRVVQSSSHYDTTIHFYYSILLTKSP